MKAEKITYNLTGQGLLTTLVYPHTQVLYKFLSNYHYDAKWHYTNQLGALRNFLHGAHHTRYEYIVLQWTLIHQLKEKVTGLGLSSTHDVFGQLPGVGKNPSGGEILQCLAILTNMGHFPDTFSASRAWLHLLKKNQGKIRTTFRAGLHNEDKKLLDKMVKKFDTYEIHLVNALFLLERYRRAEQGNDTVNFCRKLLASYISREHKKLTKLWEIYGIIRQLSYLILDSHYAPIPFVLDLSSILLNFDQVFEQILNRNSEFQKGVRQLDRVLQETLYMTGNALITVATRTEEILKKFANIGQDRSWTRISIIRDLLEPLTQSSNEISSIFQQYSSVDFPTPDWDSAKLLEQKYLLTRKYQNVFPKDTVDWESRIREKLGVNSCRVAAQYYPRSSTIKISFAINKKLEPQKCLTKCLDIVKEVMELEYQAKRFNYHNKVQYDNDEKVLLFLLKAVFGWDTSYRLEFPEVKSTLDQDRVDTYPIFLEKGAVKTASRLEKHINLIREELNPDQLHEYTLTQRVLKELNYRGFVIVFAGSTKLCMPGSKTEDAEFDSVVYLPGRKDNDFLLLIEAKNQPNGNTVAKNQLRKRLNKVLPNYLEFNLTDIGNDGACASIRFKA